MRKLTIECPCGNKFSVPGSASDADCPECDETITASYMMKYGRVEYEIHSGLGELIGDE